MLRAPLRKPCIPVASALWLALVVASCANRGMMAPDDIDDAGRGGTIGGAGRGGASGTAGRGGSTGTAGSVATGTAGNSAPSNLAVGAAPAAPGPTDPSSLVCVSATATTVDLSWNDGSQDEVGFRVQLTAANTDAEVDTLLDAVSVLAERGLLQAAQAEALR